MLRHQRNCWGDKLHVTCCTVSCVVGTFLIRACACPQKQGHTSSAAVAGVLRPCPIAISSLSSCFMAATRNAGSASLDLTSTSTSAPPSWQISPTISLDTFSKSPAATCDSSTFSASDLIHAGKPLIRCRHISILFNFSCAPASCNIFLASMLLTATSTTTKLPLWSSFLTVAEIPALSRMCCAIMASTFWKSVAASSLSRTRLLVTKSTTLPACRSWSLARLCCASLEFSMTTFK
mmetsp:Transcript_70177/g.113195  ORF Transcript_70177/g.113195 Transcript_70177/m.113195 type:complete len:236 (+) Transcript_70177:55-762(+)